MHLKTAKQALLRLGAVLCAVTALLCALAGAAAAADGDVLTVGVPADRCPVFYTDADSGQIVGIGPDLLRAAAQEAGYEVVFRTVSEPTLKDALDNPAYDVVMPLGSSITSAAGQSSIVSDNLTQTPFTLVTWGNRKLADLNRLRVGMLRSLGGGAETVRQLYPGMEIVSYDTMGQCVRALRAGQVDALLHNSYVWSYVLQKPSYADLTVQPSAMFSMDFRVGTLDTPAGRAVIERLNRGIAAVPETRRQAVVLAYTSRQLYRYDVGDFFYRYGLAVLLGVLLLAAIIAIMVMHQRSFRQENEEKLRQAIDYDPLTGALSLNGFRSRVEELLRANPDVPYLLSYNNVRNMKYINDSLGWSVGNELLRFWVSSAMKVLRDDEALCRVSGDRFAFLRVIEDSDKLDREEETVYEPLRNYFIDRGLETRVQICAGVYILTPEDYQNIDVDRILDHARVAERKVREARRDGYEVYNPEQWERGKRLADIVSRLPSAIRSGEIEVWYQPQVDYAAGRINGAEALCRWNHGKLGRLQPAEFIPTLEEAGLIYDLDCCVWEQVCRDLQRWNAAGHRRAVSVNLSRCDLSSGRDIPELFTRLAETYGLGRDQLRIEITESAFAEDPEMLIGTVTRLRELGFPVEMDDFGSGYSSLHMLKEVPVDRIKLDLHFLSGAGDTERGRIIVSFMIRMVHSLGMELIAEGVETDAQADFLRDQGCCEMQGYFFHKPMPVGEFERLLRENDAAADA